MLEWNFGLSYPLLIEGLLFTRGIKLTMPKYKTDDGIGHKLFHTFPLMSSLKVMKAKTETSR